MTDAPRIYIGTAGESEWHVAVNNGGVTRPLLPRFDLANHSPTGFAWGYGGSGPAQLALAILADALGDDRRALALHQQFKWDRIARIDGRHDFAIDRAAVVAWADAH